MGTVTTMALIALTLKSGLAISSVAGLIMGVNWFNKKNFSSKRSGRYNEDSYETERFNRGDIL